jgi:nanoRNase/pAp phosphatase (c-di-AMP/oligoRNAs hydrolase)
MTDRYSFALDHSGAMLAWKYFHPDKAVPKLVRYVEDGDLWTKKMKNTPAVYAYMNLFDFSFRNFNKLAREFDKKTLEKKHIKVGKLLLTYEKKLIAKIVSLAAVPVEFFGIRALAVNSPVFASEIGEVLYNKKPPLAIIWYEREGQLKISLRSNGKVDVAKLAEKFGGGGHKAAAAFTIAANRGIPWKRL